MNKFIEIFKPNKSKKFNNLLNIFGIRNKKEIYNPISKKSNDGMLYLSCNITNLPSYGYIRCGHVLYVKVFSMITQFTRVNKILYHAQPMFSGSASYTTYEYKYLSVNLMKTDSYELTSYEDFCKIYANSKGISIGEVKEQFVEITAEEFWNQYENWI